MRKGKCNCNVSTMNLLTADEYGGPHIYVPIKRDLPLRNPSKKGFDGSGFWTDGTNIYYTEAMGNDINYVGTGTRHYILKDGVWEAATMNWDELNYFCTGGIWTDGTNFYYSCMYDGYNGSTLEDQYVLNGDRWEPKTWYGMTGFCRDYIWTDGTNIYYSDASTHYVLNGDTWEEKTWNGLTSFDPYYIWSDGTNVYYSRFNYQYVLNGDTWEEKTWNISDFYGSTVWSDGVHVFSGSSLILNGDTWETLTSLNVPGWNYRWTDGVNIYSSFYHTDRGQYDYILLPASAKLYARNVYEWTQLGTINQ